MNKVYAPKECYIPIREDRSRTIISYGYVAEEDGINATWYEVYIPKKIKQSVSFNDVKEAILSDIDAQTDDAILRGFVWTDASEAAHNVWLSKENQQNYSEAHSIAKEHPEFILPGRFKIWEDEETKEAIYYTFTTYEELDDFFMRGAAYKKQCLEVGWQRKDSVDWEPYEAFFPVSNEQ